jgi:hypothetical protein
MKSNSKLTALRTLGHTAAASKLVLDAIKRAKGSRQEAAAALGVTSATLYRAIAELNLWESVDELSDLHGWRRRAGRARGPLTGIVLLAAMLLGVGCASDVTNEPVDMQGAAGGGVAYASAGSAAPSSVDPLANANSGSDTKRTVDAGTYVPWHPMPLDAGTSDAAHANNTTAPVVDVDVDAGTTPVDSGNVVQPVPPAAGSGGSVAAMDVAGTGGTGGTLAAPMDVAGAGGDVAAPLPPVCQCVGTIVDTYSGIWRPYNYNALHCWNSNSGLQREVGDTCQQGDPCGAITKPGQQYQVSAQCQ